MCFGKYFSLFDFINNFRPLVFPFHVSFSLFIFTKTKVVLLILFSLLVFLPLFIVCFWIFAASRLNPTTLFFFITRGVKWWYFWFRFALASRGRLNLANNVRANFWVVCASMSLLRKTIWTDERGGKNARTLLFLYSWVAFAFSTHPAYKITI